MNHIIIAGHLGADPEIRFTSSGKKVTTLRVATNSRRGESEETVWWRVTIWGEQFDKMVSFLKKGSSVVVFGEMQKPELFTNRDGKPQISLNVTASDIQFSPFGKGGSGSGQERQEASGSSMNSNPSNPYLPPNAQFGKAPTHSAPAAQMQNQSFDDEIPF